MRRAAAGWCAESSRLIPSAVERMFSSMLTPREQGDIGELSALAWLIDQGAKVSIPFGHSPDYDLVADLDGQLLRVQVKTTTFFRRRWEVTLATYGGNQSWTGLVKRFDPSRYDYLFVLVGDGRRWFIPSGALGGGRKVLLGGPKYSAFEVARGDSIPGTGGDANASTIVSLASRGDVRAAKGDAL
jgi:PD-(D/E)XK endonuclease